MSKTVRGLACVVLAGLVLAGCGAGGAAVVNGETISVADLDLEIDRIRAQFEAFGQTLSEEQAVQVRADVLERLIATALLAQESARVGIEMEDAEIEAEMEGIRGQFPGEEDYKQALKDAGLSEKELRKQLRRDGAVRRLLNTRVEEQVSVSDEDVRAYYDANPQDFSAAEQVWASHILIQVAEDADATTRADALRRINEARRVLAGGADFAATAQELSEGPTGPNGGDLGFFARGQMVPAFEEAVFALPVGRVSDVVQTQFGYHLIKATGRRGAGIMPFDEVRESVAEKIKGERAQGVIEKFVEEL